MIAFFHALMAYLVRLAAQNSYFLNGSYYEKLFHTYFSVKGFFIGLGILVFAYLASVGEDKKISFVKTIAIVALINSCSVIWRMAEVTVLHRNVPPTMLNNFWMTENVISGLVMTLVIVNYYRFQSGPAFCFGLFTYGINLFLFNIFTLHLGYYDFLYIVARVVTVALLCIVISQQHHFYTGYIGYAVYYIASKAAYVLVTKYADVHHHAFILKEALGYASVYMPDLIIIGTVLLIAVLYENVVLNVPSASTSSGR